MYFLIFLKRLNDAEGVSCKLSLIGCTKCSTHNVGLNPDIITNKANTLIIH